MDEFDYINHYEKDAAEFDYFEERKGATKHDERRVKEYIISFVPNDADLILDVGCGSSWAAKYFIPKGKRVISFDLSMTNPKRAKTETPGEHHYGLTGDAFNLPIKTNSVDCIIASEIIEHVIKPDKFVKELFKVLKPGGKLIITTPYKEKIRYNLCIHCNKKTPVNAHLHSFDEHKLKSLLADEKLESFNWKTFGNKFLVFLRTYVILKYFPFRLWRIKDRFANFFYNSPLHILVVYTKRKN